MIKEIAARTLTYMGVSVSEIVVRPPSDVGGTSVLLISIPEGSRLIGVDGEHLDALDHIVRKIALKKADTGELPRFTLDINKYKEGIADTLRTKARLCAEQVVSSKTDTDLEPMSSYERMIVHTELKTFPHIKTESVGEGRDRHIVVKYQE